MPYLFMILLLANGLSMLSSIIIILTNEITVNVDVDELNTSFTLLCFLIMYLGVTGVLGCLYHLSMVSKKFSIACNLMGGYILADVLVYLLKWVMDLPGVPNSFIIVVFIARILPAAFMMLAVFFVLYGQADIYKEMGKKKESVTCFKLIVFWIAAFAVRVMLDTILFAVGDPSSMALIYDIITIIVSIMYIGVMVVTYILIKRFCYNYYLYSYNSGR